MPNRWMEREQAIMRGLMSLIVNECDALECLKKQGEQALYDGVACKVRPTLQVCAEEMAQKDKELTEARIDNEAKRFALEFVAQNLGGSVRITEPAIVDAVRKALPGHPNL